MFNSFDPCNSSCYTNFKCHRNDHNWNGNRCDIQCPNTNSHVHEFTGSTRLNTVGPPHNHRFAGVSGAAIPRGNSHVHLIRTNTDNTTHFHQINVYSGPAISVGNGRHVHFVSGNTSFVFGHDHNFINATLIEQPN